MYSLELVTVAGDVSLKQLVDKMLVSNGTRTSFVGSCSLRVFQDSRALVDAETRDGNRSMKSTESFRISMGIDRPERDRSQR
jgi:hypothetical protein